jgi:hypothetical protein
LVIGDDIDVAFDIHGDPPIDLSTVQSLTWTAYPQIAPTVPDTSQPLIVKHTGAGGGITIVDPTAMTFTLHIVSNDTVALENENYVHTVVIVDSAGRRTTATVGLMTVIDINEQPNVISFKTQFPEFANVDDTTVQIALDQCELYVDDSWGDQQIPGAMYLAGHFLAVSQSGAVGGQMITAERVGEISVNYAVAGTASTGDAETMLTNTVYGRQFYHLLRINSGGVEIV